MSPEKEHDPEEKEPRVAWSEPREAATPKANGEAEEKPVSDSAKPADEEDSAKLKRERDEYLDLLQRSRAEFINYRRRVERERTELFAQAVGEFVKELLPVLDDLDRALDSVETTQDPNAFLVGVRIVTQHLGKILSSKGIEVIDPAGERFDPTYHHAVMVEEHPELEPGTISEVLHKGYVLKDRVLRPAQVVVVRVPTPAAPDEPGKDREGPKEIESGESE